MMTHQRFRDLLSDYVEQSLSAEDLRSFRSHEGSCAECSLLAASFSDSLRQLRSFPRLEVPADFTSRVLAATSHRRFRPGAWESLRVWLGLPRLSPAGAAALLTLPLLLLAGTREGKQVAREMSMASHRTYSNAVRLYYKKEDLRDTAVALGRKIPGQLEETVGWIRQRIGNEGSERQPKPKPGDRSRQSARPAEPLLSA